MATDIIAQGLAASASNALGGLSLSYGERLRRAARAAQLSNIMDNLPWTVAAPWAASTAYQTGAVVSASVTANTVTHTAYYVQLGSAGTSGGSAPTWRLDGITIADNGLIWAYAGDRPMAANDALAPTVALTTAGNPNTNPFTGTTTQQVFPSTFPQAFSVANGTPALTSSYWNFTGFNDYSGHATSATGVGLSFIVDDIGFSIISVTTWGRSTIAIDDRIFSPSWVQQASASSYNFASFTFSTRKPRKVEIFSGTASYGFNGIATANPSAVRPAPPRTVNAVMVSDSYDAGSSYHPFTAYGQLGTQVGHRLGWNVLHMATGGTGFCNPNTSYYTFPQRVADTGNAAKIATADVVFGYGSTNDSGYTGAQIQAAVATFYANVRAVNKTCAIIWFGPAPIGTSLGALQTYQAVDTALATAFAAIHASDKRVFYYPFANAALSTTPLMNQYQSGYYGNTVGILINAGDNVHPTDLGVNAISKWMSDTIYNSVLPVL